MPPEDQVAGDAGDAAAGGVPSPDGQRGDRDQPPPDPLGEVRTLEPMRLAIHASATVV
jgi:hypothetical protein